MIRIGVDFGGTKIEAAALDVQGHVQARVRAPSPGDYAAGLEAVKALVDEAERQAGARAGRVGVGGPGSPSPATGLMRGANSTQLNGRPFPEDLARVLGRPVRYANDANCLALSEAVDGAGAQAKVVFAAILGTGVGAGLAVGREVIEGRNRVAGEWGHMPLPWPRAEEHPGPLCWCGRRGCLELFVSGPGLARDHGGAASGEAVVAAARAGEPAATAALARYVERLARGLAVVCDLLDPDVIVLGGGLSNVEALYAALPPAIAPHVFSDVFATPVVKALHGDSSGVRGAAWLWPIAT
ncbi:MAG TPA: ROK family protein [Phenylobacterium sp.]|uniref:ROK family protein n=1 Tax=Phenylobacterium sp. TaxID=1871053 RepID=UPI002C59F5E5|nr:ROK family protein [Phenylobacterium sp.]HSV04234.1 ROK family protein [Phenylobacterium sp.]